MRAGLFGRVSFTKEVDSDSNPFSYSATISNDSFSACLSTDEASAISVNHSRDIAIAVQGKLYDKKVLISNIKSRTSLSNDNPTDAELLIEGYSIFGIPGLIDKVAGKVSFIICDARKKRIFLVRDELGLHALYYSVTHDDIRFGSFLNDVSSSLDFDDLAIYEYILFGYVSSPRTLFKGTKKIRPAHFIEIASAGVSDQEMYWHLDYVPKMYSDNFGYLLKFEELFLNSIKRCTEDLVSASVLLSGGLDSSTILWFVKSHLSLNVDAYTVGLDEDENDESRMASIIAKEIGVKHYVEILGEKDTLAIVDKIPEIISEPYSDPSIIPTCFIYSKARNANLIVGDGGDELLGGYPKYAAHMYADKYNKIPRLVRPMADKLIRNKLKKEGQSEQKINDFLKYADSSLEIRNHMWISHFSMDQAFQMSGKALSEEKIFQNVFYYSSSFRGNNSSEKAMYLDINTNMADRYNMKVVSAINYSGKNVETPFLDKDLFQHIAKFPLSTKISNKQTKVILRQLAKKHLPITVANKPKTGFGFNLDRLLKTHLKEKVKSVLNKEFCMQIGISQSFVSDILHSHFIEGRDNSRKIWSLYVIAEWIKFVHKTKG